MSPGVTHFFIRLISLRFFRPAFVLPRDTSRIRLSRVTVLFLRTEGIVACEASGNNMVHIKDRVWCFAWGAFPPWCPLFKLNLRSKVKISNANARTRRKISACAAIPVLLHLTNNVDDHVRLVTKWPCTRRPRFVQTGTCCFCLLEIWSKSLLRFSGESNRMHHSRIMNSNSCRHTGRPSWVRIHWRKFLCTYLYVNSFTVVDGVPKKSVHTNNRQKNQSTKQPM